jgi:proton glutamate symport protein
MRRIPLSVQVLVALVGGVLTGFVSHAAGEALKLLGDAFIRLIEMSIIPLIFPLIVLGVAQMESVRKLGRIAGKTILYFEVVTTVILGVAVLLGNLTNVGAGTALKGGNAAALNGMSHGIDFQKFLLHIIPKNIFAALSQGNLLPIVFFSLFFGLAMAAVGDKAKPIKEIMQSLADIMFKVIDYVIRFAPLGVFGYMAYDVAEYGWSSVALLGEFVLVVYLGMAVILLLVLPAVALIFHVKYIALFRHIGDLVVLAFITRSSEVVLAPLTERLERYGVDNSIVSFVLPIGYSFNLDGATLYEAVAVLFLAHVYNIPMSLGHQLEVIGLLMILTKGLAGVPSASIVVLIAAAKALHLPLDGIALLLGIDFIVDMARTAINVIGNSLACVVLAKSEGAFRRNYRSVSKSASAERA